MAVSRRQNLRRESYRKRQLRQSPGIRARPESRFFRSVFVIVLAMAGFWFGDEVARRQMFDQMSGAFGSAGSAAIQSLVSKCSYGAERRLGSRHCGDHFLVSWGVLTLLTAIVFKALPDVRLAWRNVWIGAVITVLLFNLGKLLFCPYLLRFGVNSAYGPAGSVVIALMWIYYTAQILLFGAKFTQVWSDFCRIRIEPVPGAEDQWRINGASHTYLTLCTTTISL